MKKADVHSSQFQLQIPASFHERPLGATWATEAAATLYVASVREPTLLFVTDRGLGPIFKDAQGWPSERN